MRSRYGLAMIAVRQNEIAASASGVNVAVVKVTSFGISGAITGLAGGLFAIYLGSLLRGRLVHPARRDRAADRPGRSAASGPCSGRSSVGRPWSTCPYYTSDIGQGQASAVLFAVVLIA